MSTAPTPWTQAHSFTSFEAANPGSPKPGAQLDAELANGRATTAQIISRLAEIQRSDGKIANQVVTPDALSSGTLAVLSAEAGTIRGAWVTATAYAIKDVVSQAGITYICVTAHTSGTFATDLAAVKWVALTSNLVAGSVTFTPAGGVAATDVQGAIAELDSEAAKKAANLSDLASASTARENLLVVLGVGLWGLKLTNNSGSPNDAIDIAAGQCLSDDGTTVIALAASLTKLLGTAWAVGTSQGGRTGSAEGSSEVRYVFLVKRTDTGVVDAMLDSSASGANLPTSYTKKRLIGAIVNNASSNIRPFTQIGDQFWFTDSLPADLSDSTITSTVYETGTLVLPAGCIAMLYARAVESAAVADNPARIWIKPKSASQGVGADLAVAALDATGLTPVGAITTVDVPLDANRQFEYAAQEGGGQVTEVVITARGFRLPQLAVGGA